MIVVNEADLGEQTETHMAEFDADNVIRVAIEGFKILIEQDRKL